MSLARGLVLSIANQVGGPKPSVLSVRDSSRFGNNSSSVTALDWTQLPSGQWAMKGVTAQIAIPNSISLKRLDGHSNSYSVALWLNAAAQSAVSAARIISWSSSNSHYPFEIRSNTGTNKTISCVVYDGTHSPQVDGLSNDLVSVWRLFVFTITPAFLTSFVNGVQANQGANTTTVSISADQGMYVFNTSGNNHPFVGLSSTVRIFSYALSPLQIRTMFAKERRLFGV